MSARRSIVQGVEVWVPQGEVMRLDSGAFLAPSDFSKASAATTLRRGEGLPGAVWATGRALHWRDLGTNSAHAAYARGAGIDAAFGLPVFRGPTLVAAFVLYIASEPSTPGCTELWNLDEARGVLRNGGGHYVQCAELERMSLLLQFQRGVGLPGQVWGSAEPVLMPDVGLASSFIRSTLAQQSGLACGLGLPIFDGSGVASVLTFLAGAEDPFLRSVEIWKAATGELQLIAGKGSPMPIETVVVMGDMLPGRVAQTQRPLASTSPTGSLRQPTGINLGLPILNETRLTHVVCLKF